MSERITLADIEDTGKRLELGELLRERAMWSRTKSEAEEMIKVCTETLTPLLTKLGITNILAADDEGVTKQFLMVNGTNSTIDKVELINRGVDPGIIAACTKIKRFVTVQVRSYKEE